MNFVTKYGFMMFIALWQEVIVINICRTVSEKASKCYIGISNFPYFIKLISFL